MGPSPWPHPRAKTWKPQPGKESEAPPLTPLPRPCPYWVPMEVTALPFPSSGGSKAKARGLIPPPDSPAPPQCCGGLGGHPKEGRPLRCPEAGSQISGSDPSLCNHERSPPLLLSSAVQWATEPESPGGLVTARTVGPTSSVSGPYIWGQDQECAFLSPQVRVTLLVQ